MGGYTFQSVRANTTTSGPQRRIAGNVSLQAGSFFGGNLIGGRATGGRVRLAAARLGVEPGLTLDWIDLPEGRFTATKLVRARAILHDDAAHVR